LSKNDEKSTKISIGMPVYNGELFIHKALDLILSQTFTDFELIISDNCSTDDTSMICEEYAKNDKRISYIKQQKNMGPTWNFNFVLQQANNEYFIWASVDDIWEPEFLEKILNPLLSKKDIVCSISKIKFYGITKKNLKNDKIDSAFRNFLKKIRYTLKPSGIYPISGSYEKKVRLFLKKSRTQLIYGLYRTKYLRKSIIIESFVGYDHAILLNVLKYGNVHVVNQVLIKFFDSGFAKSGFINLSRQLNKGILGMVFPCYPLTSWSLRNLGPRLFLKNLDYFIQLNLWGGFSVLVDLLRILIHKFKGG